MQFLSSEEELRAFIGEPLPMVCAKVRSELNELTRQWVERSPFLCLATSDERGHCDVSPRGDPAGFVKVVDDRTLLIPERPGNRIVDSLRNILRNPQVGLLFLIPGVTDTFRVNGRARLTTDTEWMAQCEVEGKLPKLGIWVEIEEAYTQCSKAFLRSHLWDPSTFQDRSSLPSNGEMMASFLKEVDAETYDAARAERYARREGFY